MNPFSGALVADLYELTMLQGYFLSGMRETAVFEFFVRRLPPGRNFLIAAGLEQVLQVLADFSFSADELDWLSSSGRFRKDFVAHLAGLRFTGDVHAMPEGTVFFPDEPILRVTAPLPEAQVVETRVTNLLNFQTMVASKAVRCVLAAPGKRLVDFGLRRAHGAEAGLLAARASYLAGFEGTSAAIAAPVFGVPVFGTMAHSFVQAHDDEAAAFASFARSNPGGAILLLDTYDVEAAARKVAALAVELKKERIEIKAVRLDSGDLERQSRKVRAILDQAGLYQIGILASGDLDEHALLRLAAGRAPIDSFGVGTSLVTSSDAPSLDCVYKLEEYAGLPRRKRSVGKETWPGAKQVFRKRDARDHIKEDVLAVEGDRHDGEALLQPVMRSGRLLRPHPTLRVIRNEVRAQLESLPEALKSLEPAPAYHVKVAHALKELARRVDRGTAAAQPA